jgi:Type III restriction enzyme, res subunit./Type I restriction enzyme R protein N terminus (HSDR_N).
MTIDIREIKLEEAIENYLTTFGGYIKNDGKGFEKKLGFDRNVFLSFIQKTQMKSWERHVANYGDESEDKLIERVIKEISQRGLIAVMRQGFKDRGVSFKLIFFKPETSLNLESLDLYEQNILTCVRQLHYSTVSENSLDMVLFVNGFPIVTMELKDQFTGQSVEDAKNQYMINRDPNESVFEFRNRSLVHFAVDLNEVYMTTRLEKTNTVFLPFNQGSNGAGQVGGAGNPENPEGFNTAYLWEHVLHKDRLLEILQKYIHLERVFQKDLDKDYSITKESIIFPRYHQLDVVTKILKDVKENGSGKNYLIQHSAGSGKSNSIAWLAHRLSGLHNYENEKIFTSVIVVTDRKILDSQLQDTIFQFDHVTGVVERVDKDSKQLKDAINSHKNIIITTLQKFPVIFNEVKSKDKKFAIIVDEAHSSQTGKASEKLKIALADISKIPKEELLELYENEEAKIEASEPDLEDKLVTEIAAHGKHSNLSFFAFTATPKDKTLQLFGHKQSSGKSVPFHIYSMRQAIEEKFILDVLKNYMTYTTYYKIIQKSKSDPELSATRGAKAILRYESLHPFNLSQKTSIIIEHFREKTMGNINGKAKAMVVTSSRLHAVRYCLEFQKYIEEHHYENIGILVAFSGVVIDDGIDYTEEKMNKTKDGTKIKESQLKEYFKSDDFNILIVAEKYQTGFDEPLLQTMFVDKKLNGVKAVQTLSRINRIYRGKENTFILDFVNTDQEIQASFQPYYESTILENETDPNVLYEIKNRLEEFQLWNRSEVEKFTTFFYKNTAQDQNDVGKLTTILKPSIDRYNVLGIDHRDEFKTELAAYLRIYSFITQVYRIPDRELHELNIFGKFLMKLLPRNSSQNIDLSNDILLEYYKIEKTFSGSIVLEKTGGIVTPIKGEKVQKTEKIDPLSEIIQRINDKFGTNFTNENRVLSQIEDDFLNDLDFVNFAKNNNLKTFEPYYNSKFLDIAVKRQEKNDDLFERMFKDEEFMNEIKTSMMSVIYKSLRQKV